MSRFESAIRIASCSKGNFMKRLLSLLTLFFLSLSQSSFAASIDGVLLERGTKTPLSDVNVYILPHQLKATTDENGKFHFDSLPEGPFQWSIGAADYEKLERDDEIQNQNITRTLYLEKSSYLTFETTIVGKRDKQDVTNRSLEAKEFAQMPGSGGDPIKAVQNLPGVNRATGLSSQVIIQGSAPQDTRYTIDGHEVPIIFHFGGLSSVVLPEAIEHVDYLSAGFGPEYSRAIGGLVGVWTRDPKTDRLHGFGSVDIFNMGGMIEGPIGKESSFLIGARQSYIGAVFKQIAKKEKSFNLTVAPDFKDLTGEFQTRLSPHDTFKLVTVGSEDQLGFVLSEPVGSDPSIRGNFSDETDFFRIIPEWTHVHSDNATTRVSLGLGRDFVKVDVGDDFFNLKTYSLTSRAEHERKWDSLWTSTFGIDNRLTWANVDLKLPVFYNAGGVPNPLSSGALRELSVSSTYEDVGAYIKNQIKMGEDSRWTLLPNLRMDYFSETRQVLPAPRLAARYALNEYTSLKGATGIYYQPPTEQQANDQAGNPNLVAPKAYHFMVGLEKDFREGSSRGLVWTTGPFYRIYDHLVEASTQLVSKNGTLVPENFNNSGVGTSYGYESLIKADFAPYSLYMSYTLSRSTRNQPGQPDYVSQYDQTHNLNLMAAVDLSENWRIASRFRYVTGSPYTPVVGGIFDADNDTYIPVRGPYFSNRLEAFYQLDVRIDKKWIYNTWILSLYLDIQNLTNHKNVESVGYSYDYKVSQNTTGLPVLPTFGVKGEF